MEKHIVDRRVEQMSAEGVKFVTGAEVGKNVAVEDLRRSSMRSCSPAERSNRAI
jgi:NADPH-dependent glutamate synthase beta subunit-like oxidoreductase